MYSGQAPENVQPKIDEFFVPLALILMNPEQINILDVLSISTNDAQLSFRMFSCPVASWLYVVFFPYMLIDCSDDIISFLHAFVFFLFSLQLHNRKTNSGTDVAAD